MIHRNFTWILAGNVLYAACQWGVLQALAIWGTPADIGIFALGLAVAAPIVLFGEKAVRILVATDIEQTESVANYLSFFLTLAVGMLVMAFVPISLNRSLDSQLVILLVLLNKILDGTSEVINGYFQQLEQMALVGQSKIIKSILSLFVLGSVIATTGSLVLALTFSAMTRLSVLILIDRRNVYAFQRAHCCRTASFFSVFALSPILRLMRVAFPLCLATLLISTSANVPRYLLAANLGEAELGIFSVLFYLTVPCTTVLGAMIDTTRPRFARLFSLHQLRDLRNLAIKLASCAGAMGIFSCVASWLGGTALLDALYGSTYSRHGDWLVLITISTLVGALATIPATILASIRGFRLVIIDCSLTLVAALVSGSVLIPAYGTAGAIYSMTATNLVHGLISLVMLIAKCREKVGSTQSESFTFRPHQESLGEPVERRTAA